MQVAGAGVAYAVLAVIMTWPMADSISSPYQEVWIDFGLFLWNLWWVKRAVVELSSLPFVTPFMFFPAGTSLIFHNLSVYNGLVGIPVQLLGADVVTTYNLLYLSSFVIGGLGMLLLVRELTGDVFASFFAGAMYTFSPARTLMYFWMNLWSTYWLPYALLFAVRLLRGPHRLDGVGLVLSLTLATLSDWHQPVLLLLTITVLALAARVTRQRAGLGPLGTAGRLGWCLLGYIVLLSPLGYLVLKEFAAGDAILHTPSWEMGFGLMGVAFAGGPVSYGVILGWVPVALAAYGMARGLDLWIKPFGLLLVGFFVLSLGEGLRLSGFSEPILPLPFLLWRKLPLLGIIRGPVYFWLMVPVCFAVLVGYGTHRLCQQMNEMWPERFRLLRPVAGIAMLSLALLELFQGPFKAKDARLHPVYEAVKREGSGGAVLDAPLWFSRDNQPMHAGRSLFYQVHHQQPLFGGYTQFSARSRLSVVERHPVIKRFMENVAPPDANESARFLDEDSLERAGAGLRTLLKEYPIHWIILHKPRRDPECDQPLEEPAILSRNGLLTLLTPAVVNPKVRNLWVPAHFCWNWGDWDVGKAQKADALVRRVLGPPMWEDAVLVAYRVKIAPDTARGEGEGR
jgi:hypothetical protein